MFANARNVIHRPSKRKSKKLEMDPIRKAKKSSGKRWWQDCGLRNKYKLKNNRF